MTILQNLDATRDETLEYFDGNVSQLNATYAPGKWTVRQLLHHLADSETVLLERIKRVLSEGRRVLWAFDQEAWALTLDYDRLPLAISRDQYRAARASARHLAERFYESHGALEWVHSETGVRTLRDEMDKVAWHNEHHLGQIRAAMQSAPRGVGE